LILQNGELDFSKILNIGTLQMYTVLCGGSLSRGGGEGGAREALASIKDIVSPPKSSYVQHGA